MPDRRGDLFAQIRDLLLFEASRRRTWQIGPTGRPNARVIAKALGVNPSTVQRILNDERNLAGDEEQRPYRPTARLERGLMKLLGVDHLADLYAALERAPRVRRAISRQK